MTSSDRQEIAFVAIGRNEGGRLKRCLYSLQKTSKKIVYVDSGSTDGSVEFAGALGLKVVDLADSELFTAARARNAGMEKINKIWPEIEFVMFIDGDCELSDGFVFTALAFMGNNPDTHIVTGRCRELAPERTIYNRLCDIEWNGPAGEIDACGGIFIIRRSAFNNVNGFNPSVIAAEDDELCIRIRANGGQIHRIDQDMCEHDADIRHFGQWWRRSVRAGNAFAQVGEIHPGYFQAPRRRAWLWAFVLPFVSILAFSLSSALGLLMLGLFAVSIVRNFRNGRKAGLKTAPAAVNAVFLMISKFANLFGILQYRLRRLFGNSVTIIEYK